ncbi:non-ribosomal peptide synthetase [Streptomyces liangshanensis]|uniref:Amino acid adenylation domain-containing protein n=1 Tax=Streptomyces liangshanensis TaxID=2717324 RepID=A0A6G9GVH3_9ACTN|nr:non-ribosomal peptide synthetase [Streptomyces liangshanensis]QIQ02258.1 amino acid adenylation domain-containing protein [Streptomyces liangshanensis]
MPEQNVAPLFSPAGAAQYGVWLTERLELAGRCYHMPVRTVFDRVDPVALAQAWDDTLDRHPALAGALVERDGRLGSVPAPRRPALTLADADTDPAAHTARVEAEIARPFRLDTGPLIRATLFQRADGSAELLTVAHHAVFDGTSKDVLLTDLADAYTARLRGEAPVPPSAVPASPATGSAEPAESSVREAAEWFGEGAAGLVDAPVLLPGVHPAAQVSAKGAGAGENVERWLEGAAHDDLRAAAEKAGVTVFELLLAAVHALLLRYGNEDAAVGVSLSTRSAEQRDAVGLFVNELPVRAPAVDPDTAGLADLATALREDLRTLYRFRAVPYGAVARGLGPRVGLTPVTLSYRRARAEPRFEGARTRVDRAVFHHAARSPLNIQVVEEPARTLIAFQYDPAVVPPDAAARIAGHFTTLLDAALTTPDRPLAHLPLLAGDELRLLTETWQAAGPGPGDQLPEGFTGGLTVVDLMERQAELTPDAVAVTATDATLDFRTLQARSASLAAVLRERGIGPGQLVAVHLDRTSALPVALFAVLLTGAAYLPLDPAYPAERLAFVAADSGASLLLADRPPAPELAATTTVLLLGDLALPVAHRAAVTWEPEARAVAADTAYVLYTSGSTGRPKGVAVGHRALVNLLGSFAGLLDSGPGHVWLGLTSLSFDISALELFLPLVTGGRLVLGRDGLGTDGPGLLRLVRDEKVTHVQATPTGWQVLLAAEPGPAGLGGLTALAGGEPLPLPLARELRSLVGRLFNVYGPTETTIWSTRAEIPADPVRVGIGSPIAHTRAHVVDRHLRLVPVGQAGELLLGGDGLAFGYLGRPELTADRFVPDPYGPPGSRLYRTGDLVVRTADGALECLGRIDQQVKIRGHRIELGEIEAVLLGHPAVARAAVTLHEGGADGPVLAAYVVPAGDAPDADALRAHLRRTLPAVMCPQRFVTLDALPTTPNGKLDRRALPVPEAAPTAAAATTTAPTTATTPATGGDGLVAALCAIWCEVLDLPAVDPEDDLFDLGGHSLTIIRIAARIRESFGVEVDFDVFFDTPTVAGIARVVDASR